MVQLLSSDIKTKEVLEWKGLHLFHFRFSSCSQKVRTYLNLKGLQWESHLINLTANENMEPYFLGINPRGMVPVLVDNGTVHVESNDIICHLESTHPEPRLLPVPTPPEILAKLAFEDELHLDIRTLTFRFLRDPSKPSKTKKVIDDFVATSSATIRGQHDAVAEREFKYWESYLNNGISDAQARESAGRLRAALEEIDTALAKSEYILGDNMSVLDIAWVVYAQRLTYNGYPVARLHPHVAVWQAKMVQRPEVAKEVALPEPMREPVAKRQEALKEARQTLVDVCFPELR